MKNKIDTFTKKLRIVKYCLEKHRDGYRLLENPENVPSTTVTMLRHLAPWHVSKFDLGYHEMYIKITKDFSIPSAPEKETVLDIKYFVTDVFPKSRKVIRKKQLDLLEYSNNEIIRHVIKNPAPVEIKFNIDDVLVKQYTVPEVRQGLFSSHVCLVIKSLLDLEQEKLDKKNAKKQFEESKFHKNFYKTLKKNLSR